MSDCSELESPVRPLTVAASVPSVIAAPSVPGVLAAQLTVGASGFTVTASVMLAVLVLPSASCVVAVAVRVKLASLVGVTLRPDKVQPPRLEERRVGKEGRARARPSLREGQRGVALTEGHWSYGVSDVA